MTHRILIITQHFPPECSGNASRIYDLSQNLVSLGSEVMVISPFPTFAHGSFKKIWKRYLYREIDGIKRRFSHQMNENFFRQTSRLLKIEPSTIDPLHNYPDLFMTAEVLDCLSSYKLLLRGDLDII